VSDAAAVKGVSWATKAQEGGENGEEEASNDSEAPHRFVRRAPIKRDETKMGDAAERRQTINATRGNATRSILRLMSF